MTFARFAASILVAPYSVSAMEKWFVSSGPCQQDFLDCISSPNYPNSYGTEGCVISVPKDFVHVKIVSFETELDEDRLEVNSREYSGDMVPVVPDSVFSDEVGTISWQSDGGLVHSGWKMCPKVEGGAMWTLASGDPCNMDPWTKCITSPNYPGDYSNDQACTITTPANFGGVKFESFDTEADGDLLIFPDGSTMRSGGIPHELKPWHGEIKWYTDGNEQDAKKGWKMCPQYPEVTPVYSTESMPANANAAMQNAMKSSAVQAAMGLSEASKDDEQASGSIVETFEHKRFEVAVGASFMCLSMIFGAVVMVATRLRRTPHRDVYRDAGAIDA